MAQRITWMMLLPLRKRVHVLACKLNSYVVKMMVGAANVPGIVVLVVSF